MVVQAWNPGQRRSGAKRLAWTTEQTAVLKTKGWGYHSVISRKLAQKAPNPRFHHSTAKIVCVHFCTDFDPPRKTDIPLLSFDIWPPYLSSPKEGTVHADLSLEPRKS